MSHVNEVEGVMPLANLALQNQSFAREPMSEQQETHFATANSGKAIRTCIDDCKESEQQDAMKEAWRASMEPVKQVIGDRLSNISYDDKALLVTSGALDQSIVDAFEFLKQKVDPTLNPQKTTWADLRKDNKLLIQFFDSHTRHDRYHFELFKCGKLSCDICQKVKMPIDVWDTLLKRPRLVPLPTPTAESTPTNVKYESFDVLKDVVTEAKHMPSYVPTHAATAEAKKYDAALQLLVPEELAGRASNRNHIWHSNCARSFVSCNSCGKRRVIHSWPLIAECVRGRVYELDGVLAESSYEYTCGDSLFGLPKDPFPHPSSIDIFHVKRALTCAMPIEKTYFASRKEFKPICTLCGEDNKERFAGADDVRARSKSTKQAHPICTMCFDGGKQPVTHGREKNTQSATTTRKRGDMFAKQRVIATKMDVQNSSVAAGEIRQEAPEVQSVVTKRKPPPSPSITTEKEKLMAKKKKVSKASPLPAILSVRPKNGSTFCKAPQRPVEKTIKPLETLDADLQTKARIESLGILVDVEGDGNCGYHVLQIALYDLQGREASTVTKFRKELSDFAIGKSVTFWSCVTANPKQLTLRRKAMMWEQELERTLYKSGMNVDKGAARERWLNVPVILPIVVTQFEIIVVVFTIEPEGNTTQYFRGCGINGFVAENIQSGLHPRPSSMEEKRNTIQMLHVNKCHFIYLKHY